MKKALIILAFAVLLFAGCFEKVAKVGCCAKANISEGCMLLNMTTSELMDYRGETNGPCNDSVSGTEGHCNVTIGGKEYLVPICTDAELNECINPNCTAMVCGDFLFKPKIAPGVVTTTGDEGTVDIPPEQEEEDARIEFYKAQCKFLAMDNKLASVMKSTDSAINIFRFGVGYDFQEFEKYRYVFPISDRFCNVNPESLGISSIRVDRYMNYIGASGATSLYEPYDPEDMTDCLNDVAGHAYDMPPFRYGTLDYPFSSYCFYFGSSLDQSEYNFELSCQRLKRVDGSSQWSESAYPRIDKGFYRKALSIAHADTIYAEETSRAPFECSIGTECYSGACDKNFYSRAVNIMTSGKEITTDCYLGQDSYGANELVCAPTTDVDIDTTHTSPPDFDYASIPVKLAKIRIRVDSYPGSAFSEEPETEGNYVAGACEGGDNVCELMLQWRDFSGLDLGEYVDGDDKGYLDYETGEQIVSNDFSITMLPEDFGFEDRSPSECDLLALSSTGKCPYITSQDNYPPAGGVVFFGSDESNKVFWNHEGSDVEIIGYIIGPGNSADLYDYWLVDRCSKRYEFEPPLTVPEGEDPFTCFGDCMFVCNLAGDPASTSECSAYCHGETELPCEITGPLVEALPFREDLIRVEVGDPDGENWQKLMDSFEPLFQKRIETLQTTNWEDGCGGRMDAPDLILSTIPWILEFKKKAGEKGRFLSSEAAQVLYDNNVFDIQGVDRVDGTPCNMRYKKKHDDGVRYNYWLLYSKYIWLIKKPPDNTLGDCTVAETSGMPDVNTYGWCEPCSGATIAYQQVASNDYTYIPQYETVLSRRLSSAVTNEECKIEGGEITCVAPWITDVQELDGEPGETGTPRISPSATVLKEKIGNYLKSGVLPVIDMTDESNWEIPGETVCESVIVPGLGLTPTFAIECSTVPSFTQYAFEDIYSDMGAIVVIVDSINMAPEGRILGMDGYEGSVTRDRIAERTGIIKTRCWRCIPAVAIADAPDNESLDEVLEDMFSDPRLRLDVDMVALWYRPVFIESETRYPGSTDEERAESTVNDMLSYSRTALKYGKTSLITNFGIGESGPVWNADNSHILFNEIVDRSGEFANTGTIGIIYTYIRGDPDYGGLVETSSARGVKGERFCNFQKAINRYLAPPPTTIFSAVPAFPNISCVNCTSIDYLAGDCTTQCANGEECILPEGALPGTMRCPTGTIVEPCRLCNETPGTYSCVYTYADGTKETVPYDSSLVSSDAYMDVLGGLEPPDKCCLLDAQGNGYSYSKQSFSSVRSIPIVYPKSGNTEIDCGSRAMSEIGFTSSFCGIEVVPVKNYKISCEFIPG